MGYKFQFVTLAGERGRGPYGSCGLPSSRGNPKHHCPALCAAPRACPVPASPSCLLRFPRTKQPAAPAVPMPYPRLPAHCLPPASQPSQATTPSTGPCLSWPAGTASAAWRPTASCSRRSLRTRRTATPACATSARCARCARAVPAVLVLCPLRPCRARCSAALASGTCSPGAPCAPLSTVCKAPPSATAPRRLARPPTYLHFRCQCLLSLPLCSAPCPAAGRHRLF